MQDGFLVEMTAKEIELCCEALMLARLVSKREDMLVLATMLEPRRAAMAGMERASLPGRSIVTPSSVINRWGNELEYAEWNERRGLAVCPG